LLALSLQRTRNRAFITQAETGEGICQHLPVGVTHTAGFSKSRDSQRRMIKAAGCLGNHRLPRKCST
jgi:hypothetical protein